MWQLVKELSHCSLIKKVRWDTSKANTCLHKVEKLESARNEHKEKATAITVFYSVKQQTKPDLAVHKTLTLMQLKAHNTHYQYLVSAQTLIKLHLWLRWWWLACPSALFLPWMNGVAMAALAPTSGLTVAFLNAVAESQQS